MSFLERMPGFASEDDLIEGEERKRKEALFAKPKGELSVEPKPEGGTERENAGHVRAGERVWHAEVAERAQAQTQENDKDAQALAEINTQIESHKKTLVQLNEVAQNHANMHQSVSEQMHKVEGEIKDLENRKATIEKMSKDREEALAIKRRMAI